MSTIDTLRSIAPKDPICPKCSRGNMRYVKTTTEGNCYECRRCGWVGYVGQLPLL